VAAGRGARCRRAGVGIGGGHGGRRQEWRGQLVAAQVEFEISMFEGEFEIAKFEGGASYPSFKHLVPAFQALSTRVS